MDRRESLRLLATLPLLTCVKPVSDAAVVKGQATASKKQAAPEFFTEHEWATVTLLSDLIIPADDRSGSASDAGVPAFIDFMMIDQPELQLPMRGGLAWLDAYSRKVAGGVFVGLSPEDQKRVLDDVAWPEEMATLDVLPGVVFFSRFRDMVATGFWTSRIGVEDLQYMGNVYVQEWTGCPQEVLDHLGVS